MKKIFVMLLAMVMLLSMAACGAKEEPVQEEINAQPKVEATAAAQETAAPTEEPQEEVEEEVPAEELKALAESCLQKDVSELYALIGKPEAADYAPSCLVEGGEDGALYYDGFVVYTIREGDVETVDYVE